MADEPLGRMVIELGLDDSGFGKGLTGARQMVKSSMAEMKSSMAVMGQSGKQFDVLAAKSKGLVKVMEAQRREALQLKKAYEGSLVDGKATKQTAKLATQYNNATGKLSSLNEQYKQNAAAMAKAKVETTGFTGGLNKASKAAVVVGQKTSAVGDKMTRGVTAPIVAGLALATKSAITFNSQIDAMGPLLTNGGTITKKYRNELDQLGDSSKKWSKQYGLTTTEINTGMSELIKRGFTTNQVIGSMPSILDATKASGEDMGTVMQATASIVEQFGLKTNSVSGTMKNTQRVTDSLTYAANATAAGFGDMSDAMSYVGPVASSLGISVEQTAAVIGELSNQGIEGQKAGTNFRGMLTSLIKPTKQNMLGFSSMGLSAKKLAHDSHDLPQLIDDITKGTKGWSNAERGKALAQAFGRENQAAANALVKAGSSNLRQLTKETENAGGATKKVASELNDTQANRIKRFQASLSTLGITIGEKLLPTFTPLLAKATDMVNAFSKMDNSTQQTILKMALLAAAAGPVLSVGGRLITGIGKLGTGTVKTISWLAQLRAKSQAGKAGLDLINTGAKGASDALGKVNGTAASVNGSVNTAKSGFNLFGKSMTVAADESGVFGTSLTAAGAAAVGVGVAVLAGAAYWEGYGKQASASAKRVDEWGSDIGSVADSSASKMQGFEQKASGALDDFGSSAKKNAKIVNDAFKSMTDQTSKDSDAQLEAAEKVAKKVGGPAGAAILKQAEAEHKSNQKYITDMEDTTDKVSKIQANASKNNVKLTSDQRTVIANLQRQMAQDEINTLHVKSSQKKAILAAELGDTTSMTKRQLQTTTTAIGSAIDKEADAYNKQTGQLAQAHKDGKISTDAYNAAVEATTKQHNLTMNQLGEDLIRTETAQGKSQSQIAQDLYKVYADDNWVDKVMGNYRKAGKQTAETAIKITGDMSKSAKSAAESWNKMVLNPKTGKVKTNAQEEVNKAAKSSTKWNQMRLLAKRGQMSSNAAAMVGVAAVQTKRWDGLSLKDKQAMIRSKGGDELAKLLQNGKQWGSLTMAEKKAIITAKGGSDLLLAVSNAKTWNKLTLKEQKAVLKDNASSEMKKANVSLDQWNSLTPKNKKLMATSNTSEAVAKGITSVGQWNNLPVKVKQLLANDSQSRPILDRANVNYKKYQDLPTNISKNLIAKDNASGKAKIATVQVGKYGQLKVTGKTLTAKDKASGPAKSAAKGVKTFAKTPNPPVKTAKATDHASGPMRLAAGGVSKFKGTSTGSAKTAKGIDRATGPMNLAMSSTGKWRGTSAGGAKSAKGIDHASGPFNSAMSAVKAFMSLPATITKTAISVVKKVTGHEAGTSNHPGGPMLVNDQAGPVFREMVKFPGQTPFIPKGRNVYFDDAPAGTIVAPAKMTADAFNVAQYATGVGIPKNADIVKATALSKPEMSIIGGVGNADYTKLLQTANDTANQQIDMLGSILSAVTGIQPTSNGGFNYDALMKRMARDRSIKSL
ncbi:phage tail tape measure protein [Lactobacillus plantarum] [Lactiplantibacillus mudanjiangensis]|uniref:phage tail tape measure protein n=1 Tax=Lactiplantibacillus mudanjiangensis TaxID=1296538 RepID=UPI0010149F70|nr:phage tail tape measure protein [Lactobacillus plantarum] [Lactiplantibacillus mudanjiangensis]